MSVIIGITRMPVKTLRQKQSKFAKMVSLLIMHAYELGYELTYGDAWAKKGEGRPHRLKPPSKHYRRLATDFNLFKNGKYLRSTKAHEPLGLYWESIGGIWGGRFGDGNHYEL